MIRNRNRFIATAIIVAAARNGVIGQSGAMPWHIPSDLQFFKKTTYGKPIIMGQKTWSSLQRKPLPGRLNIVLTRRADFAAPGAAICRSLAEAVALAKAEAAGTHENEIFIIGGGEIFRQALPLADKIYLTQIQADIDGDTFFPAVSPALWRQIAAAPVKQGEGDSHSYRLLTYEKAPAYKRRPGAQPRVYGKLRKFVASLKSFPLISRFYS